MSTSSSVLANFSGELVTPQHQYYLFKKYSNNAMGLTFQQWKNSSQMLLFSAEELCGIGAFANSFQSLTLSVEFDVYRDITDTKLQHQDFRSADGIGHFADKGQQRSRTLIGRLICLEPQLCSLSEGSVSIESVKLSQADLQNQLLGGAEEVEDAQKIDQLAR